MQEFKDVPRGDNPYVMLDVDEGTGGNFVRSPIAGSSPFWLPYVQVGDCSGRSTPFGAMVELW